MIKQNSALAIICLIQILMAPLQLHAEDASSVDLVQKSPHHFGLISSFNLGLRFSSILEKRGVIFYRDFQIDPVLGLFLLDDRVEFVGDSLGFRDWLLKDKIRLRTRLVSITDQPLFPAHESVRSSFPSRPDTYEWSNSAEFFVPGYHGGYLGEIDLGFAKDIATHHGHYVDLQGKLKLFSSRVPLAGTLVEPNLYASAGLGDLAHNRYFYGPSADAGLNNISYGVWIAFPEEADRFYPIVQLVHFETVGISRSAEFASGRNEGWLFSFIATNGFLE